MALLSRAHFCFVALLIVSREWRAQAVCLLWSRCATVEPVYFHGAEQTSVSPGSIASFLLVLKETCHQRQSQDTDLISASKLLAPG